MTNGSTAAPSGAVPVLDPAGAARDLWNRIIVIAADLELEDWTRPTPCPDWDVHDLLAHLSGIQTMMDGAPQPAPPAGWAPPAGMAPLDAWTAAGVAARRDWEPPEVLAELNAARDGHVARLDAVIDWSAAAHGPTGPTDEAGLLRVRLFDIWVHLQDLRLALGWHVDGGDASPAAREAHRYVWNRVPWMFGKKVAPPDGAAVRLRFGPPLDEDGVVGMHAGRGRWSPDAASSDIVEGDPAALTLLACGRGDADTWEDEGLLSWSGRNAQAFVERARLFR